MSTALSSKTFSSSDQQLFAELSGDINPMHMDAAAARRTQMGSPVVHGMHGVIWALDELCRVEAAPINALKVKFSGPIYVGDTVSLVLGKRTDDQLRAQIRVDDAPVAMLTIGLGPAVPAAAPLNSLPPSPAEWPAAPVVLALDEMRGQSGAFTFARGTGETAQSHPRLAERISPAGVQALAALSRLVGMVCPGLHSIFSGLDLTLTADRAPCLRYATTEVDERFRIVRVAVAGGGVQGEISAMARLPPVEQPTMADIAPLVEPGAYRGDVVVVVGGSRGLGEVTAKACAAGGARVIITYARGQAEAERVAEEIRAAGGQCDALRFDVGEDITAQLAELPAAATHLYYFATGPIAQRRTRLLSEPVLNDFMRFYATGFYETFQALHERRGNEGLAAFYPSSIAIEDTPKGWAEYAMAKAAGEILCREIQINLPKARVVCTRLPRVLTDQTASVQAAASTPVLEVILPIVRELQARA